jgi:hypothetical protein
MGMRLGTGYMGSSSLQTSTANQEIVPSKPSNWTLGFSFYKFSFDNDQACSVKINGGNPIYLRDGQGFECTEIDSPITSFIVVDSGISFNWIAAY